MQTYVDLTVPSRFQSPSASPHQQIHPITVECSAMSSACINTAPATPSHGWLTPRVSFSAADAPPENPAPGNDFFDFEFRLHDSSTMLPADELFSGGKLLAPAAPASPPPQAAPEKSSVPDPPRPETSGSGAPRGSRRWRELLGLRRHNSPKPEPTPAVVNHILFNSRHLPIESSHLLRDSDSDLVSISSSRRSLSSSSSSSVADHEDLPRLSLDTDKPGAGAGAAPPRLRMARPAGGPLAESPRMNASGRVVFEGLERSSSSPGSFTGGPRPRTRGMERRCYSANVRISPVLNVSVRSGSMFGLFSSPRKEHRAAAGKLVKLDKPVK